MKKVLAVLTVMAFCGWAAGNIHAQEWTWEPPVLVDQASPFLDEIAADPTNYDILYGIEGIEAPNVVTINLTTFGPITPTLIAPVGITPIVNDIVVGSTGQAFVCTDDTVGYYNPPTIDEIKGRPLLPAEDAGGVYKNISVGQGGKLFVLYQTGIGETTKQYILVGNPPLITEGVTISFKPRSLNLKSRGNWVSCHIGPPIDHSASDIDPMSIRITLISVDGVDSEPLDISPDSPGNVDDGKLKVKFSRSELIAAIQDVLADIEDVGKFAQATLTVQGALVDGTYIQGSDTIKIKTDKKGKKGGGKKPPK